MTHGCLKIRSAGEDRFVFLHTHHTGMDIPDAVQKAIGILADHYPYLYEAMNHKDVDAVLKTFRSGRENERLGYATGAAALIIAAYPCLLEPTPESFLEGLPEWSGAENPYELIVEENKWILLDEEGSTILDINPTLEFANIVLERRHETPT